MSESLCKGCQKVQNGGCRRTKAGQPVFPALMLRGDPHQPAQNKTKGDQPSRKSDHPDHRY